MGMGPVFDRLEGIRSMLLAAHGSGAVLSNESKGAEREKFINEFLRATFPPTVRFGNGDITDVYGQRTGQLDLVVEVPLMFSLPLPAGSDSPRLYLAEGVACAIEVKSDLEKQWDQVLDTASRIRRIRPFSKRDDLLHRATASLAHPQYPNHEKRAARAKELQAAAAAMDESRSSIPLIAVGYRGWKKLETVREHLQKSDVNGVLILESRIFQLWQGVRKLPFVEGYAENAMLTFLGAISALIDDALVDPLPLMAYSSPPGMYSSLK